MGHDGAVRDGERSRAGDFLAGDSAAVHAVAGLVRRAALPFRGSLGEDWDDVVQESLARLVEALRRGEFRGEGGFHAYARRTVYNLCIDRVRSRRAWRWTELEGLELPSSVRSPLAALRRREFSLALLGVLKEAPAECRQLWEMLLDGLSYREMSARAGLGEVALRSRVFRCRRKAEAIRERLTRRTSATVTATDPLAVRPEEG
jgi:RNA polymerase sigma factor (sigma-70 family)